MAIRNDELALFNGLISKGLSAKAAAVVLGHGKEESGNECNRLQGDFSGDRTASIVYTKNVDTGVISRYAFVHSGPGGGGYGWLQWTFWSRKEGLYDKAKALGVSIGSVEAAIAWFWEELHQVEYRAVLNALQSDMSIREMSDVFMHKFEKPADQSDSACARRANLCQQMYNRYAAAVQPAPVNKPNDVYWPPRMLCLGMSGGDVDALQGLLIAHGYKINDERGEFGNSTYEAVRNYQRDNGLDVDGIAGPKTFASLTRI